MNKQKPTPGSLPNWDYPIRDGLVLDLPMLGKGDLNDYSLNGNNGTNNGATWVAGENGPALSFDGSSSTVLIPTPALATEWSIAFRYVPGNTSSGFTSDFSGGNDTSCIINFQPGYYNIFDGSYPTGTASDSQIPVSGVGIEDFVVWTRTGDEMKGYVNGELKKSFTRTTQTFQPSAGLRLGSTYTLGARVNGIFSGFSLYNKAISAQQVKAQYDNPWQAWQKDNIALWTAAQGGVTPTGFEHWWAVNNNNLIGAS